MHDLWAALIAHIHQLFPLLCPICGGQMAIIAFIVFIVFSTDVQRILDHIGVEPEASRIAPARVPPLWAGEGAQETGDGAEVEPDWDLPSQSPPDSPTISAQLGEL